ncbi:MAG: hypothetical protein ACLT9P_02085 [Evtepia gabavorous]
MAHTLRQLLDVTYNQAAHRHRLDQLTAGMTNFVIPAARKNGTLKVPVPEP